MPFLRESLLTLTQGKTTVGEVLGPDCQSVLPSSLTWMPAFKHTPRASDRYRYQDTQNQKALLSQTLDSDLESERQEMKIIFQISLSEKKIFFNVCYFLLFGTLKDKRRVM